MFVSQSLFLSCHSVTQDYLTFPDPLTPSLQLLKVLDFESLPNFNITVVATVGVLCYVFVFILLMLSNYASMF